jgi:uncharacterized protein (DUF2252 family)
MAGTTRNSTPEAPPVPVGDAGSKHPSPAEREAAGKAARAEVPRSSHREWLAPEDRTDPVELLERQAASRVGELVPLRYGRMLASPFAFYRGAAAVMAADLSGSPQSGFPVQLCGDAHLSNFGGFAAPDRQMVFDINDFDETLPGPWEWDVKRLAASMAVAGRERGFGRREREGVLSVTLAGYRESVRRLAEMGNLEVWYARLEVQAIAERLSSEVSKQAHKTFERNLAKAQSKDSTRAFSKLTHEVDGEPRIISDPPLIVPLEEIASGDERGRAEDIVREALTDYRASLSEDRRRLYDQYRYVEAAVKVVGVGSVGTRAFIVLMLGRDEQDPLFLQIKEAQESVLEPYTAPSRFAHQGERVVQGQRLIQAAGDVLLGWLRATGLDSRRRDFYVRQLWDWKGSAQPEVMSPRTMAIYGRICGTTLAKAHARSGDRIAIGAYLGRGTAFDTAIADFAEAYADQNERDYETLREAAAEGRIEVEREAA